MTFYLSSPGSQMHADWCKAMPVLVSYAIYPKPSKTKGPWLDDYISSFSRVLVDCGAFSEFNSGKKVVGSAYKDWCQRWWTSCHIDAVAGLDDINGNWRKSVKNYELYGGFPTYHESDPPELLDDLIAMARERGNGQPVYESFKPGKPWLGVGLLPPRADKWGWVKETMARIPDDLHVHFWAGGGYTGHPRVDSADSTNWFRDAWAYKNDLPFLTPAECIELVVKRYQREDRKPMPKPENTGASLF